SAQLHPAPPESYTVFMAGCNYKCVGCQNWTISQYPDNDSPIRGYSEPAELAAECVAALNSRAGRMMAADRIFFSGGESTIHLPYIEEVMREARKIDPDVKVNFDTNGFMTERSLRRVLDFTTSITFDIKAYRDETHRALTGAPSAPVLRNAEIVGREAPGKLWEYRILVVPGMNEGEIEFISRFIAGIDADLPVNFLAIRPNFLAEAHPGASAELMNRCVDVARSCGLTSVSWSGYTGLRGHAEPPDESLRSVYPNVEASTAASYAFSGGCITHPRDCTRCDARDTCAVKGYSPIRVT
ncbi:MAG: radical SAM protein, partial [Candidatus Hydrogenedentes bacterium]|nr:radical SAM protein [Candidatus Hydrogenedentota bacterium]